MVIGCAISNVSLLDMLSSKLMFALSAKTSETELTAISHFGSVIFEPCPSSLPGGMYTLHFSTRAQMEKPLAMGPNVPAMRGLAVEANHH